MKDYKMKTKVLITGGLGFIGYNLVKRLLETTEYEITVIDNLTSDSSDINNKHEGVNYIIDDINNINNEEYQHLSFDLIFHLAALARIQPSFEDPVSYFKSNVMGTVTICELAKRCNAKIMYAASSSAEAGPKLNPYAFTKYTGEEILQMYSQIYNISTVCARFFNVYGDRQPTEGTYATIIGIFERQCSNNESLTITGDGEQRRDFTHVYDICDGLICLSKDKHNGEIYNLGTAINYSINEIAAMFSNNTTYIPARAGEARITLADISKTKKYGYNPKQNIELYIEEFLTKE
jgi:nucleoside-diphosphate-sugar epimerase